MIRYELFYSDGGHGGPYATIDDAIATAKRLLNRTSQRIDIRPYSVSGLGGYGPPVASLSFGPNPEIVINYSDYGRPNV